MGWYSMERSDWNKPTPCMGAAITRVRCYAGTSYPERPIAFEWPPSASTPSPTSEGGPWLAVVEVLWRVRTPEGLVFDVLAEDGRRYRLEWDQLRDLWVAALMS
jgi:hypothetical protein